MYHLFPVYSLKIRRFLELYHYIRQILRFHKIKFIQKQINDFAQIMIGNCINMNCEIIGYQSYQYPVVQIFCKNNLISYYCL